MTIIAISPPHQPVKHILPGRNQIDTDLNWISFYSSNIKFNIFLIFKYFISLETFALHNLPIWPYAKLKQAE